MPSLLVQQIGPDLYSVTDGTNAGPIAQPAELKTFNWEDLCTHILQNTPFPSRIFPTLKSQLEAGQLVPLNFPDDASQMPTKQAS